MNATPRIPLGFQDCREYLNRLAAGWSFKASENHRNGNKRFVIVDDLALFVPGGAPLSSSVRISDFVAEHGALLEAIPDEGGIRMHIPANSEVVLYHFCPADRWPSHFLDSLATFHLGAHALLTLMGDGRMRVRRFR